MDVELRPWYRDGDTIVESMEGDPIHGWGLYQTDEWGLTMHITDFDDYEAAVIGLLDWEDENEEGDEDTYGDFDYVTDTHTMTLEEWVDSILAESDEPELPF